MCPRTRHAAKAERRLRLKSLHQSRTRAEQRPGNAAGERVILDARKTAARPAFRSRRNQARSRSAGYRRSPGTSPAARSSRSATGIVSSNAFFTRGKRQSGTPARSAAPEARGERVTLILASTLADPKRHSWPIGNAPFSPTARALNEASVEARSRNRAHLRRERVLAPPRRVRRGSNKNVRLEVQVRDVRRRRAKKRRERSSRRPRGGGPGADVRAAGGERWVRGDVEARDRSQHGGRYDQRAQVARHVELRRMTTWRARVADVAADVTRVHGDGGIVTVAPIFALRRVRRRRSRRRSTRRTRRASRLFLVRAVHRGGVVPWARKRRTTRSPARRRPIGSIPRPHAERPARIDRAHPI